MNSTPVISVIIPCYNHAPFLAKAINSVLEQGYPQTEIIVVDDGSVDDTKTRAGQFPSVKYIYQHNQGLSAARNAGIAASHGDYLVFLDADDWLAPNALSINLARLNAAPNAAFVSGGHIKISSAGHIIEEVRTNVAANHYIHLLQGNYIGMHATVMYRRNIFHQFQFDISLKACEDYDLYLKIARKFPVIHHTDFIAYYLIHGNNMSANKAFMLRSVLHVLDRQETAVSNPAEKAALTRGRQIWTEYYTMTDNKMNPRHNMRIRIKKRVPDALKRILFNAGILKRFTPKGGHIMTGDLKRVTPFSTQFGYDRGGPVDRVYIEEFLKENAGVVRGNILEIGDNDYTLKYGGQKITRSDILHVDKKNPNATIIGDLSNAPQIKDNEYDCIILTQTLHLIYDFQSAIKTCYRVLKPGGTLLMTVPGITHIDQGEWKSNWLWAFTGSSVKRILGEAFAEKDIEVETHGNVFIAAAFLYGMGQADVKREYFHHHDPHYQVIITAKAVKPGA